MLENGFENICHKNPDIGKNIHFLSQILDIWRNLDKKPKICSQNLDIIQIFGQNPFLHNFGKIWEVENDASLTPLYTGIYIYFLQHLYIQREMDISTKSMYREKQGEGQYT